MSPFGLSLSKPRCHARIERIERVGWSLERHQSLCPPLTAVKGACVASRTLDRSEFARSTVMYQRILVPVDGSPTSNAGLAEAIKLARLTGARLRLLHVVDEMPYVLAAGGYGSMSADVFELLKESGESILQLARKQVEAADIPVDTALFNSLSGRLCDRVVEQSKEWGADLIVLGTHGRRGVRRMVLGSDAEQVLRTAPVPVLLVRAADAKAEDK
jgi:nucleotide-binding universal stress UspA family protein